MFLIQQRVISFRRSGRPHPSPKFPAFTRSCDSIPTIHPVSNVLLSNREEISRKQASRFKNDPVLRRALARADFGRELIWEVSLAGVPVADLVHPRRVSDTVVSYQIVPLDHHPELDWEVDTKEFWLLPDVTYLNRPLNLVAPHAHPDQHGPVDGRIGLCELFFSFELTIWDRLCMKWEDRTLRRRK